MNEKLNTPEENNSKSEPNYILKGAIRTNLESDAYALNNVQVTELNNYPSIEISMGYEVIFEALTKAK